MPYKNPLDAKRNYEKHYSENPAKFKERSQEWKDENREKWDAYRKEYNRTHYEQRRLYRNAYNATSHGKAKKKLYDQKYRQANLEKVRAREKAYRVANRKKVNAWYTTKYKTDPAFQIKRRLQSRLRKKLLNRGIKKVKNTLALTGCTSEFLRGYLEAQMKPGWTWQNTHIDHHIPCAAFDLTDPKQQEQCFHYSNLKLMLGVDNLKKGRKLPKESVIL